MKKLKLFALGLLSSGLLLTSCQKDEDEDIGPILSVTTETSAGTTSEAAITVEPGASLRFLWEARRGDADLQDFELYIDGVSSVLQTEEGEDLPYKNIAAADNSIYKDGVNFTAASAPGTREYRFVVTDEKGLSASQTITVTTAPGTTPLTASQPFTWTRVGGTPAVGLDQFGLKWESNTGTSAIVTKDAASKMVNLGSAAWTGISTVEELDAAINNSSELAQYTNVSVQADGTYDDVLGVKLSNGTVFMLHITDGDVTTGGTGTTVQIDGDFRRS
ncbi:MAG: hypothetical protein ACPF9D_05570 [Owenweeksia sp.]